MISLLSPMSKYINGDEYLRNIDLQGNSHDLVALFAATGAEARRAETLYGSVPLHDSPAPKADALRVKSGRSHGFRPGLPGTAQTL
jgi:hypothetical protein